MSKRHFIRTLSVIIAAACVVSLTACSQSETVVYGKVTAVNGTKITLALGSVSTSNNGAQGSAQTSSGTTNGAASGTSSGTQSGTAGSGGTPPSMPSGSTQNGTTGNGGTPPSMPSGSTQSGTAGNGGTPPSMPSGGTQGGGAPGGSVSFTANGKTKTVTISDTSIIKKSTSAAPGGTAAGNTATGGAVSGSTAAAGASASGTSSGTSTASSSASSASAATAGGTSSGTSGTGNAVTGSTAAGSAKTTASLSDITVGTILKLTYKSGKLVSVEIVGSSQSSSSVGTGNTSEVTGTAAYSLTTGSAAKSGTTMTASQQNQSAVIVSGGASLTLSKVKVSTTGSSSSMDSSSFYGLDSAILAKTGSKITVSDSTVETTGSGANAVFASGTGATVNLTNVTIKCTATGSHGVDATLGGILNLKNVNITTAGNGAAAAIATDRGGGTITAEGGTILTTGTKSPAIYSTGTIKVSNATMKSTNSSSVVVEGKNSVTVNNCTMTSDSDNAVFIYQSASGDAETGSGTFTMTGGTLTATKGMLFYSTNTTAVINLKNATLSTGSGILLKASADQWGTSGKNGSDVTLNADTQKMTGNVVLDSVSTAAIKLTNSSSLTGAINNAKTAKSVSLSLDKTSSWTVTADSYINALTDADTSLANIISGGHTVYYNSSNSANSWLGGKTVSLSGGGQLVPATW
jgi:hypothetical protein